LTTVGRLPVFDRSGVPAGHPKTTTETIMSATVEILESYCPGSRVHAMIHNPYAEGIDEG
jgi:hypothetical protein